MKYAIWAAAGIVLGFLLGGVGPRRSTSDLHKRIASLETDLAEAQKKASKRSTRFMPLPGMDELPTRPAQTPKVAKTADTPDGEDLDETPEDTEEAPFDDFEAFETAVEAQRLRATQSRQALSEQADLNSSELATFDEVVDEMNDALAEYADELLEIIESGEEPEALDMLGLSHEITGILYESQSAMEDVIGGGEDFYDIDESARQVWNYVDLDIFRDAVAEATGQ